MVVTAEQTEAPRISGDVSVLSDGALLTDFCETGREIGFRTIVERHARMVSSVCTAVLGNQADVEDAFQATFFILARKAGRIRSKESLAAWLHRVALRCAMATRKRASKRKMAPLPDDESLQDVRAEGELQKVSTRAMIHALHDQLDQLPEKYRIPLIVCYLQGEDRDEAAKRLRLSKAALHKRVQRGRAMLRRRMGVLGVACVGTISLAQASAAGAMQISSGRLLDLTVLVATRIKAGWAKGLIAASGKQASLVLAQGVLKTMLIASIAKSAITATSGALLGLVAFTTLSLAQDQDGPPQPEQVALLAENVQQDAKADEGADVSVDPQQDATQVALDPRQDARAALIDVATGRYLPADGTVLLPQTYRTLQGVRGYVPSNGTHDLTLWLAQEAVRSARNGQDPTAVNQALTYLRLAGLGNEANAAQLRAENASLTARNARLEDRVADLERQLELHRANERLRQENEALRKQVEELKHDQDDQ